MRNLLVGIPVLDNVEITRACLRSLFEHTDTSRLGLEVTVLVVDNGSSDDIAGLLEEERTDGARFPVHCVRNRRNQGVATAWNQILRFAPDAGSDSSFFYDGYVLANNDVVFGPDWLQPLVEAAATDERVGWVSALENGSPLAPELIEAHARTRAHRLDPTQPATTEEILESVARMYEKWGGHEAFCQRVRGLGLPLFQPFAGTVRSAVCFLVRPAMVEQIGGFDEDHAPIGIAEDLEYFLRIERAQLPASLTPERYPESEKWKAGFCGRSVVHHNWCSTRQGPHFDGRSWDRQRERNWKAKFGRSRRSSARLLS